VAAWASVVGTRRLPIFYSRWGTSTFISDQTLGVAFFLNLLIYSFLLIKFLYKKKNKIYFKDGEGRLDWIACRGRLGGRFSRYGSIELVGGRKVVE
jgi:hypothetical protein